MVGESNIPIDAHKSVLLKVEEPVVNSGNPWEDDLLARQEIATRLTNLVATQEPPLTVSIHGQWGTGKTFMLRRWQKELEGQKFKAIYFNAWEDDFCDDPLLAILGQLSESFKVGKLNTLTAKVVDIAIPLLQKNLLSVLSKTTGLTLDFEQREQPGKAILAEYLAQRAKKDELKENLAKISLSVFEETEHPLIFIIDELDRCRPTFAIELLERVKHIFDIPHMVFVFGINRDELCKSLSSVYGDINTDVYLRRFFDFEFNLPESDSQEFAKNLIGRYGIDSAFMSLANANAHPDHIYDIENYDIENYMSFLPRLWNALDLSLRDIDYGIRLLALLARNLPPRYFTHPYLLTVLIAMKFKKPEFYRSLMTGNFRTSEIVDYMDRELRQSPLNETLSRSLDRSEGFLYCAETRGDVPTQVGSAAQDELRQVLDGYVGVDFQVISRRAQNADEVRKRRILQAIEDGTWLRISGNTFGELAALIDTYQTQLRP